MEHNGQKRNSELSKGIMKIENIKINFYMRSKCMNQAFDRNKSTSLCVIQPHGQKLCKFKSVEEIDRYVR